MTIPFLLVASLICPNYSKSLCTTSRSLKDELKHLVPKSKSSFPIKSSSFDNFTQIIASLTVSLYLNSNYEITKIIDPIKPLSLSPKYKSYLIRLSCPDCSDVSTLYKKNFPHISKCDYFLDSDPIFQIKENYLKITMTFIIGRMVSSYLIK